MSDLKTMNVKVTNTLDTQRVLQNAALLQRRGTILDFRQVDGSVQVLYIDRENTLRSIEEQLYKNVHCQLLFV